MSREAKGVGPNAKPRKLQALLLMVPVALLVGGGAFYSVYAGLVELPFGQPAPDVAAAEDPDRAELAFADRPPPTDLSAIAFVPLDEMIISLGPSANARHLKVRVTVEVQAAAEQSVTRLMPRILDVLNTFLRAVDERDFELPRSMMRLRAQMLRRVQLVTPEGSVRDLLIQEFVLN